jgi:YD repeat-containing protein
VVNNSVAYSGVTVKQSNAEAIYSKYSTSGWRSSLDLPKIEWPKSTDTFDYLGKASVTTGGPAGCFGYRISKVFIQLGNGHWETASYNDRAQVTQMGLGKLDNTQDLLKLDFKYNTGTNYDNNGSMLEQKITVPTVGSDTGFTATQTYTYDSLNRLQSANETVPGVTPPTWKQTFSYDRYGNRSFNTTSGATTTLGSCDPIICNPTISESTNRINDLYYVYDANGSLIEDANAWEFTYDAEGRQIEAKDDEDTVKGTYFYDGMARRVKKITSTEQFSSMMQMGSLRLSIVLR